MKLIQKITFAEMRSAGPDAADALMIELHCHQWQNLLIPAPAHFADHGMWSRASSIPTHAGIVKTVEDTFGD